VTVRITCIHSSPLRAIYLTMQTILTLDVSPNNPFVPPSPPPPPPIAKDLMNIDLPKDFYCLALDVEFDSNHESSSGEIPLCSSSTKMEEDVPFTNDDANMEDALQSKKELE